MGKRKDKAIHGKKPDFLKTTKQVSPESYLKNRPAWAFSRYDEEHKWGLDFKNLWWSEILPKLKSYESQTWADIVAAPKGRGEGSKSHFITIDKLIKEAQDRLLYLKIYEDELFSLRLSGVGRLWGIINNGIFYILWYDSNHEICPSNK